MIRAIVHLDADAFFASVEQASDTRLRGKPVAVGGEKRGIIASASYEARRFGIYTPMPTVTARRLCPKLIILPGDFEKYELFSRLMFSYAYDFTPDVEIGSIDEGYFDLTGARRPVLGIAERIREAIRQGLKISVSEGVGSNKLISQIASKFRKPSALQFVPHGEEKQFLSPLLNKWLPGVGPVMSNQLTAAGLARIGQVAGTPTDLLGLLVGRMAWQLRHFALGHDERPVIPACAPAKSYGEQETFAADTTDEPFLEATLRRMADKLMAKVREDGKSIRTLTVKVRYNDMDEEQAGESLAEPTDLETDLYGTISELLRKAWKRRVSLRLVSLKFSNLYDRRFRSELALDSQARLGEAQQRLSVTVDDLRRKYGRGVLFRGHDFVLRDKSGRGQEPTGSPENLSVNERKGLLSPALSSKEEEGEAPSLMESFNAFVDARSNHKPAAARWAPSPPPCRAEASRRRVEERAGERRPIPRQSPSRLPSAWRIPLNVHSYYSFLDSTLSISAIVDFAARHDLPAIALTDRENLHGAVEFAQAAAKAGIKPIIGAELDWNGKPLGLYVQNQTGYRNLCRILSARGARTFQSAAMSEDRSDQPVIQSSPEFGSRCGLESPRSALQTFDCPEATDGLLAVGPAPELSRFFPGRFYLSVSRAEDLEARGPLPCALSLPVHYEQPSDRWKYDIVQSIRTLTLLRQQHPGKRLDGRFHFRDAAELEAIAKRYPECLRAAAEIAERCEFVMPFGKPQFPAYPPPDGSKPSDFLHRLVLQGLRDRYGNRAGQFKSQVMEELAIINDVGYEEYFLITWDFLQECRRRGIEWITRGSAADSLVCYCLGISSVCPIRFDLYFRRFLNKERMALHKLPDIDIDFAHDLKDDVVELIFEKYEPNHCAVVGGFSTFQARSAFAEIAKVLGVAEREVRKFTDHFPWSFGGGWVPDEPTPGGGEGLIEMLRASPENRDLPFDEEPYRSALLMAEFLTGAPRYPKMHPCGLVLSRQPMDELTPTFISNKGYPTTHFDMDAVEAIGLVKMDILAQGGLAALRDTRSSLAARDIEVDLDRCVARSKSRGELLLGDPHAVEPWRDPAVWEMIAAGGARAVHHIESPAMISLCKMCHVREIDGLIAIVSVIRPGAANEGKKLAFTRRYQGLEPIAYPHPSLEPCLRSTYGLVVYEEHILQLCEAFAGLPPGRADVLRRALNKQKRPIIEEIHGEFFQSALGRGHSPAKTAEVWDLVTGFAGYAFCKAHSTAYGVEAYQAAWIKRYFPAEFMAAVLTNGKGFYHPIVYVLECHRLGIPMLPPWVNEPGPHFTVTNGKIRIPLCNIKGLSNRTRDILLLEHAHSEFLSLHDFFLRVQPSNEEMETFIQVGAFDGFGKCRTTQYWEYKALAQIPFGPRPKARRSAAKRSNGAGAIPSPPQEERARERRPFSHSSPPFHDEPLPPRQLWLLPPENLDRLPSVPLSEPSRLQRLRWEEELFGYPVSGHPLELFPNIAWDTYCPINRLAEHAGREIVTCGLVIEQRIFHQITGEPMKFLTIADWTGMVETELFAKTYKSYGLNTVRYRVLEIAARVEPFENSQGFTLRVMRAGKPREKKR